MTLPVVFTANGPTGYNLTNSLRFRASASAYLNRTPASAGNRRTFTYSGWIKRGSLGTDQVIFGCNNGNSDANAFEIFFTTTNDIGIVAWNFYYLRTTQVFRDPSAWYHIVLSVDTTNATANNRMRLYINGSEVTAFGTRNNPSQNTDLPVNNTIGHQLGAVNYVSAGGLARFFDGYMDEVNFIDGQALTPTSFGSFNALTGVWQPARYTGTYGTNGFYLPFTDNSALTTSSNVGLGKDFSGNGNYWTTNNISITAGVTYDSMTDVPTLTSATTANYCVLNPLAMYGSNMLISNANLTSSATSTSNNRGWSSTIAAPSSGKWYAEFTFTSTLGDNNGGCGIMLENGNGVPGESATTVSWRDAGTLRQNASGTSYGSALTTNDVVIVAYDAALGRVWFGKNGTWFASGDPATNANPSSTGITSSGRFATYHYNDQAVIQANFGQRPFSYTPPTGFVALNTFNLPNSTIVAGNKQMDATLYTGTGSALSVTNAGGFQPDLVWLKGRSFVSFNGWIDSVRGRAFDLYSNSTSAEETSGSTEDLTSFNANGFSLGTSARFASNNSGQTYVGWQWKAGGTAVTNTAGSISSQVSANTTAGFSIVTYTGTGSNATVGHGLGVAPKMIIIKNRGDVSNWPVWHSSLSGNSYYLYFNRTDAQSNVNAMWNNTAPTSTVFSLGTSTDSNDTKAMVAYCFAQIAGYSAFGSYTGNGSADGTFVYTGFRPAFVMTKISSGSGNWYMWDNKRIISANGDAGLLYADSSLAESDYNAAGIDLLSNGFKIRNSDNSDNGSGVTVIYMAFAENPFRNALAR